MGEALNKIIKACFEGFFGTMIAGWLFYTLQSIRKNRRMLIWLGLILFAMASWRFFIPNFYSPRYAAIFLFPAILLTAYMMVKFKKWWWVLIIVMGIICCCKILRQDANGRLLINAADIIRKNSANKKHPLIIVNDKDKLRMEFYSAVQALPFYESKDFTEKVRDLSKIIANHANYSDAIYICCEMSHDSKITGENLNLNGDFKLIYSALSSRKKKIYFNVYRYCKNGKISPLAVPEGKNLIANGRFEESSLFNKELLQILSKRRHKFFTDKTQYPVSWSINPRDCNIQTEIEVSAVDPLSGKKSLRLQSTDICEVYSNFFTVNDKADFYCRIRGKANSLASIALLDYEQMHNCSPVVIPVLPVKILQDDQIMELSFLFDPAEYGVTGKYFRLQFNVDNGEVFFDDVTVVNKK